MMSNAHLLLYCLLAKCQLTVYLPIGLHCFLIFHWRDQSLIDFPNAAFHWSLILCSHHSMAQNSLYSLPMPKSSPSLLALISNLSLSLWVMTQPMGLPKKYSSNYLWQGCKIWPLIEAILLGPWVVNESGGSLCRSRTCLVLLCSQSRIFCPKHPSFQGFEFFYSP